MDEPVGYLNGRQLPLSEMRLPVTDMGFVLGTTVTEQLRSFAAKLFRCDQHISRLRRSLGIVGIELSVSDRELETAAGELVSRNVRLGAPGNDLGLSVFVTPGAYAPLHGGQPGPPWVGMHTYQLSFTDWADRYDRGQALVVTDVQQVPPNCWPRELKCRSRMHYYLADRAAAAIEPGARALLLDQQGFVTETSTANLVLYRAAEGLVVPPGDQVLPGISLAVLSELADELGLKFTERPLRAEDVAAADEVMLSSTPYCLLPVTRFNRRPIRDGRPGDVFRRLIRAWSDRVGVDIVGQAQNFA